jgi:galactoside O-acetyltransferase
MSHPLDPGYFRSEELRGMGFARVGEGSAVARTCTVVGVENVTIGDHVRIDGYTTIVATRGTLAIGNHVHICSGCVLGARGGIRIGDYASLSHGVKLLSAIDDWSGDGLTNSTVPADLVRIHAAPIVLGRFVPIGSNAVVLPGVVLGEGAALAAMSLAAGSLPEWTICGGNPAVALRPRARTLLDKAARLERREDASGEYA